MIRNHRLLLLSCCLLSLTGLAQVKMPQLTIKGEPNQLKVTKVDTKVTIHGQLAETRMTLTFLNTYNRQLEGELNFPLPEGATVSGYALDINGQMVDGVVVTKEKARVVFEKEVRKGIDPGIVEVTKGNNFKTRVYPIFANKTRTVMVRYITELNNNHGQPFYQLPLNFEQPLQNFDLEIAVIRPSEPPQIRQSNLANFNFSAWEQNFIAKQSYQNLTLTQDLIIDLPKIATQPLLTEQAEDGHYFYFSQPYLVKRKQAQRRPDKITIFWDASSSRANTDLNPDYQVITRFFETLKNHPVTVDLISFSNTQAPTHTLFEITAEKSDQVIDALKTITYDGGTQLGTLTTTGDPSDFCLLFTDGLSNFGSADPTASLKTPLYIFNNEAKSNHDFLRYLADASNGKYFNLKRLTPAQAISELHNQSPTPTVTVTTNGQNLEIFPKTPQITYGKISFSGKIPATTKTVTITIGKQTTTYTLDETAPKGHLLRLAYAQNLISDLLTHPKENSDALIAAGKTYGLVTPGTSLMVLETLHQYLTYEIMPPDCLPEWQATYKAEIARRHKIQQTDETLKINRVLTLWEEVTTWHQQTFTYDPQEVERRLVKSKRSESEGAEDGGWGGGWGADPFSDGKDEDFDEDGFVDSFGDEPAQIVEEDAGGWGGGWGGDSDSVSAENSDFGGAWGGGSDSGSDDFGGDDVDSDDGFGGDDFAEEGAPQTPTSKIAIKSWDPQTPYLTTISADPTKAYAIYLEQKAEFGKSPAFYLDCADYFRSQNQQAIALRILSNIAEMELENHTLLRILAHRLTQLNQLELAASLFEEVKQLRPEEPQSYRDLAQVYAAMGQYTPAIDLYNALLDKNWDRFAEIEKIALVELNNILTKAKRAKQETPKVDERLIHPVDADLRIVLNWDADQTDMDLWVTEPSGEKCMFSYNRTQIGGRMSTDYTNGYGPEEYILKTAIPGTYKIEANYFGSNAQTIQGAVTLQAEVYTNYGRENETCQKLTFRLTQSKNVVAIGEIQWGETIEIQKATALRHYQIKPGDTLPQIAKVELNDANAVKQILDLNPGLDPEGLKVGQVIKLP